MTTAQAWETEPDPLALLEHLFPVRGLDSTPAQTRQSRYYLVACARRAWGRLPWVCRAVVQVAERITTRQEVDPAVRAAVAAAAEELTHCQGEPEAVAEIEQGLRTARLVRPVGDDSPPADADPRVWTGLAYLVYAPFAKTAPHYRWVPAEIHSAALVRDVFGNPFRRCGIDPDWRTRTALGMARGMYADQDFSPMPVLADALEDAGCTDPVVLAHCRGEQVHVRGCWVLEGILRRAGAAAGRA
ncbi:MAG: hypothetical protein JWO38_6390 [Gemmataceae bacterium]|nr:hypothetical protein [Gemmataceae bacterium]